MNSFERIVGRSSDLYARIEALRIDAVVKEQLLLQCAEMNSWARSLSGAEAAPSEFFRQLQRLAARAESGLGGLTSVVQLQQQLLTVRDENERLRDKVRSMKAKIARLQG